MNLIDLIDEHTNARPHSPALITSQEAVSWSQLDSLIWSAALMLREKGLKAGDRVGITMAHPVMHFVTSLALARMGVGHIAIPILESDSARNELANKLMLKSVLCDSEKNVAATPNAILHNQLTMLDVNPEQKKQLKSTDGNLTWLILQSSGTTGSPKFAELTHNTAHDRFVRFLPLFNCTANDVFWAASRPDFVVAKQRLTFCLLAGAAVCIPTVNTISADLLKFLNQQKVTLTCGTPSHLHQLIAIGERMPTLRVVEARSAFIDEKLRHAFKSKVSSNLHIVYGTNEGETLALATPALQAQVPNTVGAITASIKLEVVDAHGNPVPSLQTGEIRVRGPGVVTSYLNNPEATAKSFKEGWFYPGDLGYLTQEGALILQGRKDDMMIFDGMNIYPAEIENVLSAHPAVKEVAAFSVKHERFQDLPVAAVTLNQSVTEKDLVQYCKASLGVKCPRRVLILGEFPRNAMGKILKRELSSIAINSKPDSSQ